MTEDMAGYLLTSYLEYEVPNAADLWPTVRARLLERQRTQAPERHAPKVGGGWWSSRVPRLWPMMGAALAVALALAIVASPTARAELLAVVQRYWFAVVSNSAESPARTNTAIQNSPNRVPIVSLEDAEQRLGFRLPQPESLPADFVLGGVIVESADAAALNFVPGAGGTDRLTLRVSRTLPRGGDEVTEGSMESVVVDGHPGLFTEETDLPSEITSRSVTWQEEGYYFLLTSFGQISRVELLAAAESVSLR